MIISSIKMGGYGCKCEVGNAFCPDTIIEAGTPEFGDSRGYTGVLRKGQETEGRNGLCRGAVSVEIQERGCFFGSLHEGSEKRMCHDHPAMSPVEKWVSYPRAADPTTLTRAAFRMVRVLSLMPYRVFITDLSYGHSIFYVLMYEQALACSIFMRSG